MIISQNEGELIKMTMGIYKITNLITNKSYIGLSKHIEQRWQEHKNGKGNKLLYQDFM